jgi:1,4-alpha-glucan branching enzyme
VDILHHVQPLHRGEHLNPHICLGPKLEGIYVFKPHFKECLIEYQGKLHQAKELDSKGLFFLKTPKLAAPTEYRVYQKSGELTYDPYAFWPTLQDLDFEGFLNGIDYTIYLKLGAHSTTHQGVLGVRFAVWAPNAKGVCLSYDENHFSENETPMRNLGRSGVFEIFIPGFKLMQKYKFIITQQSGKKVFKADPFGFYHEMRPGNASCFFEMPYTWQDHEWMKARGHFKPHQSPINIYEVHLGSWKKENHEFLNYVTLANELSKYCQEMGYTHIEIMPIMEHPLDESWGYQVTGFYAVTSRFGTPDEFRRFIDIMHQNKIGVILDWVGAHFPVDEHGLIHFDGTHLFEHQDPKKGFHPQWNTLIFNYGRKEVSNFLIASVLFWLKEMHLDGIRMDAVSSMLYLDFGRPHGEFIPNQHGGIENLEAIEWLKHLNVIAHQECPGTMMIAEESTAFPKVTHPVHEGGLGFDFKSNLGWMNDTLRYFEKDPIFRAYHHNLLTFYLMYAFSENFALFLSHDEVVHGKKSLISKMPGSYENQFKNVKLLIAMMMTLPGKKLLFMGGEIGQWNEWDVKNQLDWHLLNFPIHDDLKRFVSHLNHFYLQNSSFWKHDHSWEGFEWIESNDFQRSCLVFVRKDFPKIHLCVHNASGAHYHDYPIYSSWIKKIEQVFHSESECFGGWIKEPMPVKRMSRDEGFLIDLPPFATIIFKVTT